MKKILIVDDEPFIAKSIKLMIDSIGTDFTVCGIATNGNQALQLCEETCPDIILTDIRMPVMDGLELIRQLSRNPAPPLFIILSGYGEFEYAQKALKMGVFDYLLKPLEPSALKDALERAAQSLDSDYEKIRSHLLWNILSSQDTHPDNENLRKYFNSRSYAFMLLNAGSYFHLSYSPSSTYMELWETHNLIRFLPDIKAMGGWMISGIRPNERIIIFETETLSNPEQFFSALFKSMSKSTLPISCIYGIHTGDIFTINESISKYRLLLNRNTLFGYSTLVSSEVHSDNCKELLQLSNTDKEELLLLFQNRNINGLTQYITGKISLYEKKRIRQIDLQFFLLEILYLLNTKLPPAERDQENLLYFVTDIINNTWSYETLTEEYMRVISELIDIMKKDDDVSSPTEIVNQVEQYILQHYTENLNLQKLADIFGFVPPYLSRIYKRERGISPSDYILNLKIDRIKHLLKIDPKLPLKVIAESTGFNDSFYMSKVFKLATGFTPSEYRSKYAS